ncbi:MAG: hypothetical protein AB1813_13155 [Verrucomicrobiota bacterium]
MITLRIFLTAFFIGLPTRAAEPKSVLVGERPESVIQAFGGHFYVTVRMGDQPGDGRVRVVKDGRAEDFATRFDEPKGITYTGTLLIVADSKKIWKIDDKGRATILAEEKNFPKPISYLSDVASALDGKSVYVCDMGANTRLFGPSGLWALYAEEARTLPAIGRIYHVLMDGRARVLVESSSEMPCPNSLIVLGRHRLLISEFFMGNIFDSRKADAELIATGYRGASGIAMDRKGMIYVSSGTEGKIWRLDRQARNPEVLVENLHGPGDFFLDERGGQLVIPETKTGKLLFVPLKN